MNLKSSTLLVRSLVVVASVATASVPTVRNHDAGAATIPNQVNSRSSGFRTDCRRARTLLQRSLLLTAGCS